MLVCVGWYGRKNLGDETFKLVFEKLFSGVEKKWICDLDEEFGADDVFVLGGGDVFLDYYLQRIPPNAPFFIYGVGLSSTEDRKKLQHYKNRLLGVWLRNADDVHAVRKLGIDANFTPDIAFQLAGDITGNLSLHYPPTLLVMPSNGHIQGTARIGPLKDFYYQQYLKYQLAADLDKLSGKYRILLVPLSFDCNDFDLAYCCEVRSQMSNKIAVDIIESPMDFFEMTTLIKNAHAVISMKFHGIVYATMCNTPFVNIGLTRKAHLYCKDNLFQKHSVPAFAYCTSALYKCLKHAESSHARGLVAARSVALATEAASAGIAFARVVQKEMVTTYTHK